LCFQAHAKWIREKWTGLHTGNAALRPRPLRIPRGPCRRRGVVLVTAEPVASSGAEHGKTNGHASRFRPRRGPALRILPSLFSWQPSRADPRRTSLVITREGRKQSGSSSARTTAQSCINSKSSYSRLSQQPVAPWLAPPETRAVAASEKCSRLATLCYLTDDDMIDMRVARVVEQRR
jgi:hypothetical protein